MSRLEEKKLVVDELKKVADEALSAVVVDYRGTNVPDLTLLRKDASSSSVYLRVIKNTLAKRALEGTKFDSINEILTGPSLFAFSLEQQLLLRTIYQFAQQVCKELQIVF